MKYIFGTDALQMFGAGDLVNYAGDGTPSNAGSYNTNLNTTVETGHLAVEVKEFYDEALIRLAGPNLVHDQFGQKRPIPQRKGDSVEWRNFSKLPKALTPITEGVTPTGSKIRANGIYGRPNQYGDYVETTDRLNLVAIDNVKSETAKLLADQAGLTLDTVVRNELVGGTNVMYCPSVSGGTVTPVNSRTNITGNCRLRVKDVFKAAAILKSVNTPKINGSYVAIIHPDVSYDLMMEAGEAWIGLQKNTGNVSKIYNGELGSLGGVRFVESTEAKIWGPAEINNGVSRLTIASDVSASTSVTVNETLVAGSYSPGIPVYVDGTANTITAIAVDSGTGVATLTLGSAITKSAGTLICGQGGGKDGSAVYATLFLGENAYGVTSIEGGGLQYIAKQLGYGNDPLDQRGSQGWKAIKGAKRPVEEYMLRVESGGEFSDTAEAN